MQDVYSEKERKAIHAILAAAVRYLATNKATIRRCVGPRRKEEFVCCAIQRAGDANSKTDKSAIVQLARGMIRDRLENCYTVDAWLTLKCGIPESELTLDNLQAYRHRWLAAMIEEFSK